jgi:hypothetical protein
LFLKDRHLNRSKFDLILLPSHHLRRPLPPSPLNFSLRCVHIFITILFSFLLQFYLLISLSPRLCKPHVRWSSPTTQLFAHRLIFQTNDEGCIRGIFCADLGVCGTWESDERLCLCERIDWLSCASCSITR